MAAFTLPTPHFASANLTSFYVPFVTAIPECLASADTVMSPRKAETSSSSAPIRASFRSLRGKNQLDTITPLPYVDRVPYPLKGRDGA